MWQKSLVQSTLTKVLSKRLLPPNRFLSATPTVYLNQKWRQERGLPLNPNAYGVLTDGPDYTFLDGRPTPYGIGQKNRVIMQKEIAEQVIKLTAEVDFAVDRHQKLVQTEEERKRKILDSKLKPKGIELLKKKK